MGSAKPEATRVILALALGAVLTGVFWAARVGLPIFDEPVAFRLMPTFAMSTLIAYFGLWLRDSRRADKS